MELIADLLGKYQGAKVEVFTNGGQSLCGVIENTHQDYFTLLSVTRLYFVPYTGISAFYLPPEPDLQRAAISDTEKKSPVGGNARSKRGSK